MREYLSHFEAVDPTQKYPFPDISFPATAIINHKGIEHAVASGMYSNALDRYTLGPSFRSEIRLPVLVDPKVMTLHQLTDLEPGHGAQLNQAYQMALGEQEGVDFNDPLVVRMVGVLPVGKEYVTDFVPKVSMKVGPQAWNPYLLVGGRLNPSSDFLQGQGRFLVRDIAAFNHEGRETSLRVRRPTPGSAEQADSLMPLTDHELNSMGVILFPYLVEKKPPVRESSSSSSHGYYGEPESSRTLLSSVGGAEIDTGQVGWMSADKRSTIAFGDTIYPENGGRPYIFSVRLLTAQR